MTIYPCAKINLGLNITSKRPDGYHNLETVFYPVDIHDTLDATIVDGPANTCSLHIKGIDIPGDTSQNLVVKAYHCVAQQHTLPCIQFTLDKQIPTQAGMGGGSADCAYTILLLNKILNLDMDTATMQRMAARLGADCAFFISPTPSFATGIGDVLTPVGITLKGYHLAIVKPCIAISTREAFSLVKPMVPIQRCCDILTQSIETWRSLLVNDFETSAFSLYPELQAIKLKLYEHGAIYAAMSGSGSAMFGIFKDKPDNMTGLFPECFCKVVEMA